MDVRRLILWTLPSQIQALQLRKLDLVRLLRQRVIALPPALQRHLQVAHPRPLAQAQVELLAVRARARARARALVLLQLHHLLPVVVVVLVVPRALTDLLDQAVVSTVKPMFLVLRQALLHRAHQAHPEVLRLLPPPPLVVPQALQLLHLAVPLHQALPAPVQAQTQVLQHQHQHRQPPLQFHQWVVLQPALARHQASRSAPPMVSKLAPALSKRLLRGSRSRPALNAPVV